MDIKTMLKKQSSVMVLTVMAVTLGVLGMSYAAFFRVANTTPLHTIAAGNLEINYISGSTITQENAVPVSEEIATGVDKRDYINGYTFTISNPAGISTLNSDYEIKLVPSKYYRKLSFPMECEEEYLSDGTLSNNCLQHVTRLDTPNGEASRVPGEYLRFALYEATGSDRTYTPSENPLIEGTIKCLSSEQFDGTLPVSTCLDSENPIIHSGTLGVGESATYMLFVWLINVTDDNGMVLPPNDVIGKLIAYDIEVNNKITTPLVTTNVTNGMVIDFDDDDKLINPGKNKKSVLNDSTAVFYLQPNDPLYTPPGTKIVDPDATPPLNETFEERITGDYEVECFNSNDNTIRVDAILSSRMLSYEVEVDDGEGNITTQTHKYDRLTIEGVIQDTTCNIKYNTGSSIVMVTDSTKTSLVNEFDEEVTPESGTEIRYEMDVPTTGSSILKFTPKNGYAFSDLHCDNLQSIVTYNKSENELRVVPGGGVSECRVVFSETLAKHIIDNYESNGSYKIASTITNTTSGLNKIDYSSNLAEFPSALADFNFSSDSYPVDYRYQGPDPENYVNFYRDTTWRIIGVIQVKNDPVETGETINYSNYKVLLRSVTPILGKKFSASTAGITGYIASDWRFSLLRAEFPIREGEGGEIITQVEPSIYFLGGRPIGAVTPYQAFFSERDESGLWKPSSNKSSTVQYINPSSPQGEAALPYMGIVSISDYGFASTACENTSMTTFNATTPNFATSCAARNWIYVPTQSQWTLTLTQSMAYRIYQIKTDGTIAFLMATNTSAAAYPTVYLKSDVTYVGGDGKSSAYNSTNNSGLFQIY